MSFLVAVNMFQLDVIPFDGQNSLMVRVNLRRGSVGATMKFEIEVRILTSLSLSY